jgi:methylglyoxal synthase
MSQTIALVAHDARKDDLVDWAAHHTAKLAKMSIYATGTTGQRLIDGTGLEVTRLKSGPMGGDAQLGALIAEGKLDGLIFFIDPLSALPHDVDVKSLLRLAILYNTPLAVNRASATGILAHLRRTEASE